MGRKKSDKSKQTHFSTKEYNKDPPVFSNAGRKQYSYYVHANLENESGVSIDVLREKWNTKKGKRLYSVARSPDGRFVASRRWRSEKDTNRIRDTYASPVRTLMITSDKIINMRSSKNRKMLFDMIAKKYSKAGADKQGESDALKLDPSSFKYRYTWDSINGVKVKS